LSSARVRTSLVLVAGLALGVLTLEIARAAPTYSFTGESVSADFAFVRVSVARAALELVAGWVLLVVAVLAMRRGRGARFGGLLVGVSFAWFITDWNNPGIGSRLGFAIGLVLYAAAPALVAHAALAYPAGCLSSLLERATLIVAYAGAVLVIGLLPALVYDPAAAGCTECPRNLLLLRGSSTVYDSLNQVGVDAGLGWSLALILVLGLRLARASRALRRVVWPVLAAAAAFLGLAAWDYGHSLGRGTLGTDSTDRAIWLGEGAAVIALAAGVAWNWVRVRRTRAAVARLVVDLVESPSPGGLRELLAGTLGDPSLQLAYPLDDGRLVDGRGRAVTPEGAVTPLVRGQEEIALLAHRPGLLDDPDIVTEVVSAARLALENERLQAESQARLEDLRASRARVVAAADGERRRLERDLHDGAQQWLVALSLALRLARAHADDPIRAARLAEADDELRVALEELRTLAHGIFPAVLADEGLAAALETLADETAIPIEISSLPPGRFDRAAETAAYYLVVEALRQARPTRVRVGGERSSGCLSFELETDGVIDDVVPLEDRVGAIDGSMGVVQDAGRVRIHAEIPCES
jgi:signal transduction histidine kinase